MAQRLAQRLVGLGYQVLKPHLLLIDERLLHELLLLHDLLLLKALLLHDHLHLTLLDELIERHLRRGYWR